MNLRTLGIINNRIAVGINTGNGNIFVHASSNCIELNTDEQEALMSVLTIAQMLPHLHAYEFLMKKYIKLWEPMEPTKENAEPHKDC